MPAGAVSLHFFILGLLAQRSMSGYDIKRYLSVLNWLIGSPSGGSLYPVLRTLLQEDLVTVEVVPGIDKPPRKIYSITEAGHQTLQDWIDERVPTKGPLKAFVMHLLIADSHSHSRLRALLQQRRAQVAAHHARLSEGAGSPDGGWNRGERMTLDYGLALAQAELNWLDCTLERLSEQPHAEEDE
jgi:PadR family transcriptional regulator AphA